MSNNKEGKTWLNEISFMRPLLILFLVAYHAFAPYVGSWEKPDGIGNVELYRWIGLLSRAFRLEGFIFISGYIFTFQVIDQQKFNRVSLLLKSKIERLLIPCFFFSALYLLSFKYYDSSYEFIVKTIQGAGHLWYLTCLFWCFIIHYLILKNDKPRIVLPALIITLMLSISPLPLGLNRPLYYLFFFYAGGLFWKNSQKIASYSTTNNIILCWFLFAVQFVIVNVINSYISEHYSVNAGLINRACLLETQTVLKAILACSGILALYLSAVQYCHDHRISDFVIKVGTCGYGVYVFHQFILVYLYRYTGMPALAGTYLLPWCALIITVAVSVTLTLLVRKTKIGRKFL